MISILLSVHNGATTLEKTLLSITAQSYPNWEIIAVDDASNDRTFFILKKFQEQFPSRVEIIQNTSNQGLTKSLITTVKKARGEFFARIDSGDQYLPKKLEKQIRFLQKNPDYGIVGCNYINRYSTSGRIIKSDVALTDEKIRSTILRKNPFAHSAILIRKNVYQKTGGYNETIQYGQDYELWFRVLKVTKVANLPEYLCIRDVHQNSIGMNKRRAQMKQCLKTQFTYMNHWNPTHYLALIEPLLLYLTPNKLREGLKKMI